MLPYIAAPWIRHGNWMELVCVRIPQPNHTSLQLGVTSPLTNHSCWFPRCTAPTVAKMVEITPITLVYR